MAHIKLSQSSRKNKDGTHTIELYVKLDGEKNAIRPSTGERVRPEEWDPDRRQIRGRSEDVKKRNILLRRKVSLANEILADYALMNVQLTNERFRHEFNNPSTRADFLHFYRTKCQQNYDRGIIGLGTYEGEARTLRKLETWKGKIMFSDINRRLLEDFDAWHGEQLKKKGVDGSREREKALKHIRKYLNAAKSDDSFPYKFNWPFDGFVWPRYKNRPEFLTEEEARTLLHYYRNIEAIHEAMIADARRRNMFEWNIEQFASEYGIKRIQRTLKWFLFQCFTGLRYSDLERVTWQHIEDDHLVFVPLKTQNTSGAEVRIWLSPIVWELMGERKRAGRIMNVISNQKYNSALKEVARIFQMDRHLTTHVGRHTFATMSLNRGIPIERLKYLMGVTSVKTLMIYVHITQGRLDDSMKGAYEIF